MDDVTALVETALEHHQRGDLEQAERLYRRILTSDPEHGETHYLLGTALLQLNRFAECIPHLEKIVALRPDLVDASNNLGIAFDKLGKRAEAIRHFETAIRFRPDYEQARYNLGTLHLRAGALEAATQCFRDLVAIHPGHAAAWFQLASLCKAQGQLGEAAECFERVIELVPDDLRARITLGEILVSLRRPAEAIAMYEAVVSRQPDYSEIHANLSLLYEEQGSSEAAIASGERSVRLKPGYAEGWNHLGLALRSAHRTNEAIEAFQRAIRLKPDFALAQFNLAATLLMVERYREGWPLFAEASEKLDTSPRRSMQKWNGQEIAGKRLLIEADQGLGDTIQFARFLNGAKVRANAHVILECPPKLREVMTWCEGVDLVEDGPQLPGADFRILLSALPALLGIDANSLPGAPYIRNSATVPARLQTALATKERKVGLVWQGNPENRRDFERSCPLLALKPLFDAGGVKFVLLQDGDAGRRQLVECFPSGLPANVVDACAEPLDFPSTAAVMSELDLVITVDTSMAHLAGALGRPVWTMLCFTPDWRWQLDRPDSPWYPTMRLFRQPRRGDWDSVVREVAGALQR